jgi:uncharacterized damage-inducible protein DinB
MIRPILDDAFGHHVWATLTLIDTCLALPSEQLETTVPGTYGSIIDTMRHLVGGDAAYLFVLTGGRRPAIDEEVERQMGLADLRDAMAANGPIWSALLAQDLDPDTVVIRHRDDGSESHAPMGVRLAQAIHHGTDHRSQICTALTTLGIEPPAIDVWDYAHQDGRLSETEPTS